MSNTNLSSSRSCSAKAIFATAFLTLLASLPGCGAAESVYHDGDFTAEQKAAAQAEYQSVEDQESQGSNKKKKSAAKR